MNFGQAIESMTVGCRVARSGWNGKGMWIRWIDLYTDRVHRVNELEPCDDTWMPFLLMKTVDNKLVPWLASQTDMLAEDWEIVT